MSTAGVCSHAVRDKVAVSLLVPMLQVRFSVHHLLLITICLDAVVAYDLSSLCD